MSVNAILTGQTKEPNIDLTKANVTGILPVAKGGTGNATGAIDLTKGTGILPIANGGTGASSAGTALSNLGGITQATADGRYLGKTAKAADSAKLGGMTTGGKTWPFIASVAGDGVMEIGQYIDFHTKSGLTTDYDGRISLTGNAFDMGGKKLSGVGTPTAASDAATKQYVDNNKGITQSTADGRYQRIDHYDAFIKTYAASPNGKYYVGCFLSDNSVQPVKITTSCSSSSGTLYMSGIINRTDYDNASIANLNAYPVFIMGITLYNATSSSINLSFKGRTNDATYYAKYILLDYNTNSIKTSSSFTLPGYTSAFILTAFPS